MMATAIAVLVFGSALGLSVWAIVATVLPARERIGDLLKHRLSSAPEPRRTCGVRSTPRDVKVQSFRHAVLLRAAV